MIFGATFKRYVLYSQLQYPGTLYYEIPEKKQTNVEKVWRV